MGALLFERCLYIVKVVFNILYYIHWKRILYIMITVILELGMQFSFLILSKK